MRGNEFFYVRDKRTGQVSRVSALPFIGQNSYFEEVADPRLARKKLPEADADDLSAGLSDVEDSS